MRSILDELPRAIKLSNILNIIFLILTIFYFVLFVIAFFNSPSASLLVLFVLLFIFFQYWLFRKYKKACKLALETQSSTDVEQACRHQATIIKFYGVLSLLMLLLVIIGILAALTGVYEMSQFI